jgi:anti-anti-sigma factor
MGQPVQILHRRLVFRGDRPASPLRLLQKPLLAEALAAGPPSVAPALLHNALAVATQVQTTGFNLQRINQGEVQILSLGGNLTHDEFGRMDRELAHLREEKHRRVILDLAQLTSATTMSLARLLVCGREFRRHGGELKLAGLSPWLRRLAELAGFDRKKDFSADVVTALKAMSPPPEAKPSRPPKAKP